MNRKRKARIEIRRKSTLEDPGNKKTCFIAFPSQKK